MLTSGDSPCKGRDTCAWAGLLQGRDTLAAMAWMVWFLVSCSSGSGPLWTLLILGAAAHPGLLLELLPNSSEMPSLCLLFFLRSCNWTEDLTAFRELCFCFRGNANYGSSSQKLWCCSFHVINERLQVLGAHSRVSKSVGET